MITKTMENKTAEEWGLPWSYQEQADAYTHIIRDRNNKHILQGKQIPNGTEEAKIRFIIESVNASLQCAEMKRELDELRSSARAYKQVATAAKESCNHISRLLDTEKTENISLQNQCAEMKKENERLKERIEGYEFGNQFKDSPFIEANRLKKRIEELEAALSGIEPFASEVVSRQTNESVFGYNSEMLTLSSLKKIIKALNHDTINKP